MQEFELARVTPSPAVFDFEKLYWINRHYIKTAEPERIAALTLPFYRKALGNVEFSDEAVAWLGHITDAFSHQVNKLDELPERAKAVLGYDAKAAIELPENAEILKAETTGPVLDAFCAKLAAEAEPIEAARFKAIIKEVQKETGIKGPALFHPIRILLTGAQSGPEFDKLVPLMEEGAKLGLSLSVKQRIEQFRQVWS